MPAPSIVSLLRDGTFDAELAALVWLLVEGRVPLVVTGAAESSTRLAVAHALLSMSPDRPAVVVDMEADAVTADRLAAWLQGGVGLGLTVEAADLRTLIDRLAEPALTGLPEDAVRRLGVVVVLEATEVGTRVAAAHYLRPTERDGQGHLQRRPPAVLATWDAASDAFEHFAWGVTPELADRVDRSQADLEERQRDRAALLRSLAEAEEERDEGRNLPDRLRAYLAAEPPRVPAPARPPATPSPFHANLADPHEH